jgi:Kef-type K+ transport system membrane component KefB
MSATTNGGGVWLRIQQIAVLVLLVGLLFVATRVVPESQRGFSVVAAVGFLLLVGTLVAELLERVRIPHLTGYIVAGVAVGPYGLHLLDHETVAELGRVNTLAVAIIALAGGAELKLETLRGGLRMLLISTGVQTLGLLGLVAVVFFFCRPLLPFTHAMTVPALIATALLWGVLAIARSPSATLGILAQTRARGPVMDYSMSFVMSSNLVVIVVLATVLTLTRPLMEPGATLSLAAFSRLGHELLGSISLGTTLGLALAAYLRFVDRQLLPVLLLLGFGFTEVVRYLNFEPMLAFLVAGFVVRNLSRQGDKFTHALEGAASVVFVIFFAGTGAHLDVPLLRQMWVVALVLCAARGLGSFWLHRLSSRLSGADGTLRKWGWSGLVSQAGVALGIGAIIEPLYGSEFRALVVATVSLNEMIGPVIFKLGLDRSRETATADAALPDPDQEPNDGVH